MVADSCLVEQNADAAMNLCLEGAYCTFGDQHVKAKRIPRSSSLIFHFASFSVCCFNTSSGVKSLF